MSGDGRARALEMAELTQDQKDKLGTAPNWKVLTAPLVPLYWVAPAADKKLNEKGGVFDNFKACYTTTLKAENKQDKANKEMNGDGFEFFSKMEEEMSCSGVCWKPVFGIARNIKDGIVGSLDTLFAPGIVCLITAFILIFATCGALPLCCGFDKDEEGLDKP